MAESADDLLGPDTPETESSPAELEDDDRTDDDPGLSAEESLALLPPE